MIESNPLLKLLVAEYFKVRKAEDIEIQINNYQKLMERKRHNAYQYFLKSKSNPEIKHKMDENRKQWYDKHKERVQETRRERLKNDPEFRDKVNAKKREYYQRNTANIPKQKRGRKPKNKENNDDSNDSSNDTKTSDGEDKQVESKTKKVESQNKQVESQNEGVNKFKEFSNNDITPLIKLLQKTIKPMTINMC